MKLYRCELCGRVFNQKTPHKCYGGCFRKHCLTFTEFEDVDNEYIKRVISDVKEDNFPNIPLEPKNEYLINWEQARVDAAIGAMQGIIANSHNDDYRYTVRGCSQNYKYKLERPDIAHRAVLYADALIAELKKKGE